MAEDDLDAPIDPTTPTRRIMIMISVVLGSTLYSTTLLIASTLLRQMQGAMAATRDEIAWAMTFSGGDADDRLAGGAVRPPQPTSSRLTSLVEPDILHAPAVEGAVDHDRQALDIGALAGAAAAVENDRPHTVVGQLALDRP